MNDPRPGFSLITDAYSLGRGAPLTSIQFDDVWYGRDPDGQQRPFAVVRNGRVGFRGTIIPTEDHLTEWITNFDVVPVSTPWGYMARGVWEVWKSFVTHSGKPVSAYALYDFDGHSQGAGLAAIAGVILQGRPTLWACPNWFCREFGASFSKLGGAVYAEAGDIVPMLPLPLSFINPRLGPLTHLIPLGTGDLAYHHAFETYVASFEAQFPAQQAA